MKAYEVHLARVREYIEEKKAGQAGQGNRV